MCPLLLWTWKPEISLTFSLSLVFLFGECNFRCPSSSPMVTVSWRTRAGIVKQIWFLNSFAFYKRCHVFDITYKLFQWECRGKAEKEERWRTGIGTLNGRWNWARSEAEEKLGRWEERYAKHLFSWPQIGKKGKDLFFQSVCFTYVKQEHPNVESSTSRQPG